MAQGPIIAPRFCVPNHSYLSITKNSTSSSYDVTDMVNQNLIFKVQCKRKFLDNHMLLLAPAANPIAKLRLQPWTRHQRWQVFRGDSDILLFSGKQSSSGSGSYKTKLLGFLAHNRTERFPDFSVQATWKTPASGVIYAGDNTSRILAQMQKESTDRFFGRREDFMVTVRPGIDYAFIVAVIVILDNITYPTDD